MKFQKSKFFASCPQFLETLLSQELKESNIVDFHEEKGGVEFHCHDQHALDFILSTRMASRVFKFVWGFTIKQEKEIYQRAREVRWTEIMDSQHTFKITTLFDREATLFFRNSLFLSQLLKDAVVDTFREKRGVRPDVDIKNPDFSFLMRVSKKKSFFQVDILLDLCGEPLSNRYYRSSGHPAPLRENLAAALIKFSDFDPGKDILLDSMCGTGTILIEAALIKAGVSPCYIRLRNKNAFAFLKHNWFKKSSLQPIFQQKVKIVQELSLQGMKQLKTNQFFGFEKDRQTLLLTQNNLENSGLRGVIHLELGDATNITSPGSPPGIIICNPPYGERMGEDEEVAKLMFDYGENLKRNFKNFRAYILTLASLRKKISLSTSQRIPLKNGNIECQLVKYQLY